MYIYISTNLIHKVSQNHQQNLGSIYVYICIYLRYKRPCEVLLFLFSDDPTTMTSTLIPFFFGNDISSHQVPWIAVVIVTGHEGAACKVSPNQMILNLILWWGRVLSLPKLEKPSTDLTTWCKMNYNYMVQYLYMYTVSWRTPGLPIVFKQLLDPQSRIIFFHAAACWHVVNEPSSLHEKEPHLLIGLIFILFKCVHVYIWIQSDILLPTQHIKENQWKLGWIYPFMVDF